MLKWLRSRGDDDEQGFTLIELMVVVLIIAILMAIAIPTFLGSSNSAKDSAVQQTLENSLSDSLAYYGGHQNFGATANDGVLLANLTSGEPNIHYIAGGVSGAAGPTAAGTVYVTTSPQNVTGSDDAAMLYSVSKSGKCWYVVAEQAFGTVAQGNFFDTLSGCTLIPALPTATTRTLGSSAAASVAIPWGTSW
jgi:type IV pilus assembly protein PilA